ncbi:hypothetical protein [Mycobacterium branderi]|nr:hypothetical protein [Mycobacterium branderi]MCV7235666.1 hypothetical protein [Mycobacterium branderi]
MGITIRLVAALPVLMAGLISACAANAEPSGPPKFPDMSSYASVKPDDYAQQLDNPGRPNKLTGYYFNTPDGIQCSFDQLPAAICTGNNLPAIPAPKCDPAKRIYPVNTISTQSGLSKTSGSSCNDNSFGKTNKVLPPFHKLTVYGVTCGVDDKKMTACKDPQGRGFVLSPSWSGWLPHV